VLPSIFLLQYVNRESATALEDLSPFFLVLLCMEMAALMPLRDGLIVLALSLAAVGAAEISVHLATTGGTDLTHALPWYIGVIFGWLGGYLIQSQLRVMAELKAAQVGLAERAAAGERQRMAQELHDVIAHSLTVTMLHITGARKAMQRSSEEAAEALEQAERLGRQSLSDLRRVVGVLGSGASGEHAPMPDAMDVEKLVSDVNAAGAEVALETRGDLGSIAPTTSLALYRIVQESLTNASKHAPGSPTRVDLDVTNGHVSLTVANRLPTEPISTDATADGLGLWGMSERARVLGGTFAAGPQGDEWVVRVKAPTADRT
jgi:signal transduction histidine kinase